MSKPQGHGNRVRRNYRTLYGIILSFRMLLLTEFEEVTARPKTQRFLRPTSQSEQLAFLFLTARHYPHSLSVPFSLCVTIMLKYEPCFIN